MKALHTLNFIDEFSWGENNESHCRVEHRQSGYMCTRARGHIGKHAAHYGPNHFCYHGDKRVIWIGPKDEELRD